MVMEGRELDEASQKSVIVLNVGGMIIVLADIGLTWLIVSFLGINLRSLSLLAAYRVLLLVFFLVTALPVCIFGEYWLSNWRKRAFMWKSAVITVGVFAVFVFTSALLSTLFDILFAGRDILFQLPFLGLSNIIGLLVMALTIRARLKKWRKEFGW